VITIHNFARGVRGLRVMWQCEEMGLPYQVRVESWPTSAAYRALNPLGTVPYLQDDDAGVGMFESVAMLHYLAQRYGPTPLLPLTEPVRLARVLQLLELGEATLGAGLNTLLAARFAAPQAEQRNWSVESQQARCAEALGYLAGEVGAAGFVAGEELTLADISLATAISLWQGPLGRPLAPPLQSYLERLTRRTAYRRAHARCQAASSSV
jgi:glutathione S-transferase